MFSTLESLAIWSSCKLTSVLSPGKFLHIDVLGFIGPLRGETSLVLIKSFTKRSTSSGSLSCSVWKFYISPSSSSIRQLASTSPLWLPPNYDLLESCAAILWYINILIVFRPIEIFKNINDYFHKFIYLLNLNDL